MNKLLDAPIINTDYVTGIWKQWTICVALKWKKIRKMHMAIMECFSNIFNTTSKRSPT